MKIKEINYTFNQLFVIIGGNIMRKKGNGSKKPSEPQKVPKTDLKKKPARKKTEKKSLSPMVNRQERINAATRKIALTGILGAEALALSFIETLLPDLPMMPPHAKFGFSNIVTMYAAYDLGIGYALFIAVIKAVFALLRSGTTAGMLSLAGGVVSVLIAAPLLRGRKAILGFVGIGILSAVMHNAAQVTASILFFQADAFLAYLPGLIIFSLITGLITGFALSIVIEALKKYTRSGDNAQSE